MSALRTSIASLALVVAGGTLLGAATDGFRAFTSEAARRIAVHERPVMVPSVPLQTHTGELINLADLRGRWLLVDFIYARCPTLCRSLGADFAALENDLAEPIVRGRIRLLSISIDPSEDSPHELSAYLGRAHRRSPGWLAARPVSEGALIELKRSFGITAVPDGLGGYVHNAAIYVVDPQGRLVEIQDLGAPAAVVRTLRRYRAL